MQNPEPKEIITKETIDQELMEKAMADQRILEVLDKIELFFIVILVLVMIYLTYKSIRDYFRKKKLEQQQLMEEQHKELLRKYNEDSVDSEEKNKAIN